MSIDKTILRRGKPKFGINEVAYSRAGAIRGFIEPLPIIRVDFDPGLNTYVYTWGRDLGPAAKKVPAPFVFPESQLLTLCEALDLQIPSLERDLAGLEAQMTSSCPNGAIAEYVSPTPEVINGRINPPAPRFGYNEVVYLRESAEALGRLEAYRVTDFYWEKDFKEWVYKFFIQRRPGRTMTVGDRGDMTARSEFDLIYPESELATICEALPLAVTFMRQAVTRAKARRTTYCPGATDAGN
jgi:hypothetical protein